MSGEEENEPELVSVAFTAATDAEFATAVIAAINGAAALVPPTWPHTEEPPLVTFTTYPVLGLPSSAMSGTSRQLTTGCPHAAGSTTLRPVCQSCISKWWETPPPPPLVADGPPQVVSRLAPV